MLREYVPLTGVATGGDGGDGRLPPSGVFMVVDVPQLVSA